MSKLVEGKIGKQIKRVKRGSTTHDGMWYDGEHYIALFAIYILRKFIGQTRGADAFEDEIMVNLLTCSSLGNEEAFGAWLSFKCRYETYLFQCMILNFIII